jgi:hypothetical protein
MKAKKKPISSISPADLGVEVKQQLLTEQVRAAFQKWAVGSTQLHDPAATTCCSRGQQLSCLAYVAAQVPDSDAMVFVLVSTRSHTLRPCQAAA